MFDKKPLVQSPNLATGLLIGHVTKISFAWRIFLLALVLRLVPVLLTRSLGIGLDDMFQYDMLARSLASGNGYRWYAYKDLKRLEPYVRFDLSSVNYDPGRGVPTSFRAPLYPAFLALIYLIFGTGPGRFFAVRLVQAGLGALLAPLTYHVSRILLTYPPEGSGSAKERHRFFLLPEPASVIAAWVVACYPMLLVYPIGLATENLFFLLLLASFFFLLKIPQSDLSNLRARISHRYSLLSGIFLALAILTRSVILPFAGLAVLWVWFALKQKRSAVILTSVMFVVISPWVVRNSFLHHKLTGIESSMGYNLYLGYYPSGNGTFIFGPSLDLVPILDDARRDALGTQKALAFIHSEPGRFLPLALDRLSIFFGLEKRALTYFYSNNLLGYIPLPFLLTIAGVFLLPFIFIAIFAALGLSLTCMDPGMVLLILLLFAYILPHVLILSEDRFHLAILPYLAILAVQAWTGGKDALVSRWQASLAGKVVVSLGLLSVLLLCLNWGLELSRDADTITALLGLHGNQTYFPY